MSDYATPGNRKSKNDKKNKRRYNIYKKGGRERILEKRENK